MSISVSEQYDWAGTLIEALEDSSMSTGTVVSWLRANLGALNNHIRTEFTLSGDYITPGMSDIQSGIYNEMFYCNFLHKKARAMVGSMTYDWIEMEGDGQGHVRRVSNTQKAVTYQSLARDCDSNLKELIKKYNGGNFAVPRQITFNDRYSADAAFCMSDFNWSCPCNNE